MCHHEGQDWGIEYWECRACDVRVYKEKEFKRHTKKAHPDMDSIARDMFTEACSCRIPDITSCPLCNLSVSKKAGVDRLALLNHIAEELHEFSLLSLPPGADHKSEEADDEGSSDAVSWASEPTVKD
jgi:rubredoxin